MLPTSPTLSRFRKKNMSSINGDLEEIFDGKPWPATYVGIYYGDAYAW